MPYTKIIQSGDLVEEWVYERVPAVETRDTKKPRRKSLFPTERRADSILRCKDAFKRLVRANLSRQGGYPALMTVNMREIVDISVGYAFYTQFSKNLRRRFGDHVSLLSVPEFQQRGALHFHTLIWGLPPSLPCRFSKSFYWDKVGKKHRRHVCPKKRNCERKLRTLSRFWPHGFLDIVETDGSPRLSTYLSKYMSKAMHDERLVGKRAYTSSGELLRPVSLNRPAHIELAKDQWGMVGDNLLHARREYDTLFLGRCVKSDYLLQLPS